MTEVRVGIGYDSHRFDPARPLILGGVHFPDHPGLVGFSDADAVAHAVIDAVLGAVALGDVGTHFPPGEDAWRDADSMDLLERAIAILGAESWSVWNVDVTVVCESPRIGPRAREMRASLAARLRVPVCRVSIKGKSNEGMGWIGRREGLAVQAVAAVVPVPDRAE